MSDFKTLPNPFLFASHDVRTAISEKNEVFFCAKDVCEVLDISWTGRGNTLRSIPETWVMVSFYETIKGERETIFINEPAVYKLAFSSRKPAAEAFANWVCSEVLPAIRKNGFYGTIDSKDRLAYSKQIVEITTRLTQTKDAMLFKLLCDELRDLCNLVGRCMPDLKQLGRDYKQLDCFVELEKLTGGVQ
jgi:prophage antirepressor-like protein